MDKTCKLAPARVAVFLIGFLFQTGLQIKAQPYLIDGYRYQAWSSEFLMQTVSIEDLRNAPLESLTHIHILPPGLDLLRALLVQFRPKLDIQAALRQVDLSLYFIWSILYSLIGVIIFQWLAVLIGPKISFVASMAFLLHPAAIAYTTLLDSTIVSSFLIAWLLYALWKFGRDRSSIFALTVSSIALFFFRAIFQLPFVIIMGVSLYLLKAPRRKLGLYVSICGGICGLYIAKQYGQFGVLTTSSFNGVNLIRSVGVTKYQWPYVIDLDGPLPDSLPNVLTRKIKIDGSINYNNLHYVEFNKRLVNEFFDYISAAPASIILRAYYRNLQLYFNPSSLYTDDVIVERLPWRSVYDSIFSAPFLIILLISAMALWLAKALKEKDFTSRLALLLPALYIFSISVLCEQGENNRFKFFLEPVFYVFIVSQFYGIIYWAYRKVSKRYLRHG